MGEKTEKMTASLDQIKTLRDKTGAGIMDCRQALEESDGDLKKAANFLRKRGVEAAAKREGRETSQGTIDTYRHSEGKIVAAIELLCETDFVARTDDFKALAHEIAMQAAAMNPETPELLLNQPWIRDEKITIGEMIKELAGKTGENIQLGRILRWQLGEK